VVFFIAEVILSKRFRNSSLELTVLPYPQSSFPPPAKAMPPYSLMMPVYDAYCNDIYEYM
jgi:hypothetical protein